ncbi:hypothetical protein N7468_002979 [Penicillium chermesinum]|uniref:Uncharacterized protein n=1 Tax=Penicillium chermesinum TaxID=63820 RepID=A0A9W9TR57_9EURO|nr:uncharacterized protein N7468_002979 [Penicillium chermesinum]KAJ5238360.1 hypothetical protein N7468_002979 [Penicillium chermesinum]
MGNFHICSYCRVEMERMKGQTVGLHTAVALLVLVPSSGQTIKEMSGGRGTDTSACYQISSGQKYLELP